MHNGVSGKMICDSVSPDGIRLSTMHLRYPRMIHSEVMTHRAFSRNGRSSRAVPVKTLIEEEPYVPHFMKNKPGMVATEELEPEELKKAQDAWLSLVMHTKHFVTMLSQMGVHKQWANRPLEWFGYIDVLISSTDWANYMALRDDPNAQPEIISVAHQIKHLLEESKPQLLQPGQWHLPYINIEEDSKLICAHEGIASLGALTLETIHDYFRKLSVARCARLSIRPFDGDSSIEKELARYERLVVSRPVHASPAEHIATPDTIVPRVTQDIAPPYWEHRQEHGNFYGWRQYRRQIPFNVVNDR